jgi:hypothetical protein
MPAQVAMVENQAKTVCQVPRLVVQVVPEA